MARRSGLIKTVTKKAVSAAKKSGPSVKVPQAIRAKSARKAKKGLAPKVRSRFIAKENARRMREWEVYTPIVATRGRPLGYEQRKFNWNTPKRVRARMLELEKAGLTGKSPAYQNIKKYAVDRRDPIWNVKEMTDETGEVTGVRITPLTEKQMRTKFDEIRTSEGYDKAKKFRAHYYDTMEAIADNETLSAEGTRIIDQARYETFKENYGDRFGDNFTKADYDDFWYNFHRAMEQKDDHYGSDVVVKIIKNKSYDLDILMQDPSLFDKALEQAYNQSRLENTRRDLGNKVDRFELNNHGRRVR